MWQPRPASGSIEGVHDILHSLDGDRVGLRILPVTAHMVIMVMGNDDALDVLYSMHQHRLDDGLMVLISEIKDIGVHAYDQDHRLTARIRRCSTRKKIENVLGGKIQLSRDIVQHVIRDDIGQGPVIEPLGEFINDHLADVLVIDLLKNIDHPIEIQPV